MEDLTITCKDCGTDFVFSAGERTFYQEKGFTQNPVRCKECRDKRKATLNKKKTEDKDNY